MSTLSITPVTKKLMATYTSGQGQGETNGIGKSPSPLRQNMPLDVLQLDPVERAVVIIGGEFAF